MWREIYLDHGGWSIVAAVGTAVVVGAIVGIVVALFDMRTPHISRRPRVRRWHPLRRVGLVGELLVRLAYAIAARVLRPSRKAARR